MLNFKLIMLYFNFMINFKFINLDSYQRFTTNLFKYFIKFSLNFNQDLLFIKFDLNFHLIFVNLCSIINSNLNILD